MKFSTREDIEAPAEVVFAALSDFSGFERAALRRGVEVVRSDTLAEPGPGMRWEIRFAWRGKRREVFATMTQFSPPREMRFAGESGGFNAELVLTVLPMSRTRARLGVEMDLRPRSITARLMIQSMKLAKVNLSKRFAKRVQEFGRDIEERNRLRRV